MSFTFGIRDHTLFIQAFYLVVKTRFCVQFGMQGEEYEVFVFVSFDFIGRAFRM